MYKKDYLSERISNLTDVELKQCWEDIKAYNEHGMMGETLVRQIRNEYAEEMKKQFKGTGKMFDIDCSVITIPNILYEIAKRRYQE